MTLREAITEAASTISRRDAETLLAHLLQQPRTALLAHPETLLNPAQIAFFTTLTTRRAAGEPLQYLTGTQEFYGLTLRVTPAVLIPRPETELLVEQVLLWATAQPSTDTLHLADIGTGSGAIAIALATHLAAATVIAVDTSESALAIAQENALAHHCADRIIFLQSDLLAGLDPATKPFDAIVSNPPYIPAGDATTMQREVVNHEPHTALFAGPEGLDIYRRLIPAAHKALRKHGLLALEFGFGQRDALAELLAPWHNVRFLDDYAGIPRIALAERP